VGRERCEARAQCGDKRADVGLCVKHAGRGLCVPDYVRPAAGDSGWTYSQALAGVVEQYKARASPYRHRSRPSRTYPKFTLPLPSF